MYLNDDLPVIDQIGEKNYLENMFNTSVSSDSGASFFDADKYKVLFSCKKERLEKEGVELPLKASECYGFFRRTCKPKML